MGTDLLVAFSLFTPIPCMSFLVSWIGKGDGTRIGWKAHHAWEVLRPVHGKGRSRYAAFTSGQTHVGGR
jgi:hypothetical protein